MTKDEIKIHVVERKQVGFATPSITVPAIAYYSGGRVWYAITIPFGALKSGIVKTASVKKKGQEIIKSEIKNRFLDKAHKDDIKKYMKVEKKYTIPPVTLVSLDLLPFEPIILGGVSEDIKTREALYTVLERVGSLGGLIQLPLDYQFECLDGNHRTVAIKELAEELPEITQGSNLLLNIVCESDILKIRQDFVDVNKNAKQTTPSINTLFNTRDPIPNLVSKALNKVEYLENITDLIGTSISKNSIDVYTLNNIKNVVIELSGIDSQGGKAVETKANELLKDNNLKEHVEKKIEIFFKAIRDNYYIDDCIKNRTKTPEIRAKSILTTGIGLLIAAYIANHILENYNRNEYRRELQRLIEYDWSRNNHIFKESGIVTADGNIVNSRATINKTKEYILINLGYEK
ncbi:DNA sulfur modification protein DndB [Clostridium sp. ZBS2]|uniref:DNA sulfur modification protein DndB n=1 Tax=Clostridium sp. ZBS2 TaxID=2949976 RepID=UPI0020797462|nr:DNA sulfur modification protein DndB [Clostridium sp. ZBS2]